MGEIFVWVCHKQYCCAKFSLMNLTSLPSPYFMFFEGILSVTLRAVSSLLICSNTYFILTSCSWQNCNLHITVSLKMYLWCKLDAVQIFKFCGLECVNERGFSVSDNPGEIFNLLGLARISLRWLRLAPVPSVVLHLNMFHNLTLLYGFPPAFFYFALFVNDPSLQSLQDFIASKYLIDHTLSNPCTALELWPHPDCKKFI